MMHVEKLGLSSEFSIYKRLGDVVQISLHLSSGNASVIIIHTSIFARSVFTGFLKISSSISL